MYSIFNIPKEPRNNNAAAACLAELGPAARDATPAFSVPMGLPFGRFHNLGQRRADLALQQGNHGGGRSNRRWLGYLPQRNVEVVSILSTITRI